MPWSTQVAVQLQAGNTIINPSGQFVYSGAPGAGNLIYSVAPSSTTQDNFGNAVFGGGAATYGASPAAALFSSGQIQFQNVAGGIAGGYAGQIVASNPGVLALLSGGTAAADSTTAQLLVESLGAAGVGVGASLIVLNAGKTSGNGSFYTSLGTANHDNNSGTTFVSGERAFMNTNWADYMNSINTQLTAMFG